MHKKLLVFDIETVIDTESASRLLDLDSGLSEAEIRTRIEQYHLDITGGRNSFVRQLFHRVVAISFAQCDIEYLNDGSEVYHLEEIRSGGTLDSSEEDLIAGFFSKFNQIKPRLVSYNGRYFDLPVLKYRAIKYNVQAKFLFKGGDKWNNYHSRYATDWHCDLIDAFSDYGASAKVKMSEVSALLGIPCKTSTDGSMVQALFDTGKLKEIRNYCEEDVVNTYVQYLKYQYLNGTLSYDSYQHCIKSILNFLDTSDYEHFIEYASLFEKTFRCV